MNRLHVSLPTLKCAIVATTFFVSGLSSYVALSQAPADSASTQGASHVPDATLLQKDSNKPKAAGQKTYYIEAGSYGTKRESDPPPYTRNLSKLGLDGTSNINWLDVGLDYRIRYEHRVNDIRRPVITTDDPFLLRTRAYVGLKNLIDPFRFAVEFEDARRVNGQFPEDNKDFNRTELIQVYGELYIKKAFGADALGNSRPLSVRIGRMAFEALDRRFIAVNQWRNTTNNALGIRTIIGQEVNDWQLQMMVSRPILRLTDQWDQPTENTIFSYVIGHWRRWSDVVTIEPYYLSLLCDIPNNIAAQRNVNALGSRLYGWVGETGWNYDISGTYQFGEYAGQEHNAAAWTSEAGYTFQNNPWKPRLSVFYAFVSGDHDPNDNENNRFERFFGFGRPWSSDDYIVMENVETTRIRAEFEPVKGLRIDGGYGWYWLASNTDRMYNLLGGKNNRDSSGESGDKIGNGLDIRARFKVWGFADIALGYSHFTNGEFVLSREEVADVSQEPTSDFAYVEMSFNAFDLVKNFTSKNQ